MDEGLRHKTDYNLSCLLPDSTVHKIIATQAFVTLNRTLSSVQLSDYMYSVISRRMTTQTVRILFTSAKLRYLV